MQFMQMMKAARNPQQAVMNMLENQVGQNPMAKNTIEMAQKGDMNGIEQMARNLCKEKGINADEIYNSYKQKFGI